LAILWYLNHSRKLDEVADIGHRQQEFTDTLFQNCLNFGSSEAFNAFISLQLSSLMLTYFISIGCVLYRRFCPESGARPLPKARWSLGRLGVPCNIVAVLYSVHVFFWSFWPESTPVDRSSMNYAIAIFGGTLIVAALTYAFKGRKVYKGPVVTVEGFNAERALRS
jgi:choline transport protein